MIYTVFIDKVGKFLSRLFNTYEEAEDFAKEEVHLYGELGIYKYFVDGETELIRMITTSMVE